MCKGKEPEMGLSSNQARFLSLTSRQIDMEQRIQQICQRRLRLSSELENVATTYNNSISNRKMFTASQTNSGIDKLSLDNLSALGYKVFITGTNKVLGESILKKGVETSAVPKVAGQTEIHNAAEFMNIVTQMNSAPGAAALSGNYILMGDIDLSTLPVQSGSLVKNAFTGSIDGNGYTISGLNINDTTGSGTNVGMFSELAGSANISNLVLDKFTVNTKNSTNVGTLAGLVDSAGVVVDNVAATNTTVSNPFVSGDMHQPTGGLVGKMTDGTIVNSYTTGNVSGSYYVGGLVGWVQGGRVDVCSSGANVSATGDYTGGLIGEVYTVGGAASIISRSYATGNVTSTGNMVGGLIGKNYRTVEDSYATGNVSGGNAVGGICGATITSYSSGTGAVIDSYASGSVTATGPSVGGLVGSDWNGGTIKNSFWMASTGQANGYTHSGDVGGAEGTPNTSGNQQVANNTALAAAAASANWSTNVSYPDGGSWDTSTNPPTLYKPTGYVINYTPEMLEEGLRNGTYSLATPADEYTQDSITLSGKQYEAKDWRSSPVIYDELNQSDDAAAEDKYDRTIDEINAQDKKLQLEQTSIETEYKAVSSEKDAVKKILDTNATSSFKYFS